MKRIVITILTLTVMAFCLCSCGGPDVQGLWYCNDEETSELLLSEDGECNKNGTPGTYKIEKNIIAITYYNDDGTVESSENLQFNEDNINQIKSDEYCYFREKSDAEESYNAVAAAFKEENLKNVSEAFSGVWIYDSKWNESDSFIVHNTLKLNEDGSLTFKYSVEDQNISGEVNGKWSVEGYDDSGCYAVNIDIERISNTDFYGTGHLGNTVELEEYMGADNSVDVESLSRDIERGTLTIEIYQENYQKEIK